MARLATAKKSAPRASKSGVSESPTRPRAPKASEEKHTTSELPPQAVAPGAADHEVPALESEFMQAMQEYKRISGRMFPTWSEVLEVLQSLGYRKIEPSTLNHLPTNEPA